MLTRSALVFLAFAACLALLLGILTLRNRASSSRRVDSQNATPLPAGKSSSGGFGSPDSPIMVEVTGREFYWRFRYCGRDGEFDTEDDIRVGEELHLPVDRDVVLQLKSDDYVYTLSIPQLKLREIAVPELTFTLKFRTTDVGSFELLADPLCSVRLFHDEYMGRVVVQSQVDFDAWLEALQ